MPLMIIYFFLSQPRPPIMTIHVFDEDCSRDDEAFVAKKSARKYAKGGKTDDNSNIY